MMRKMLTATIVAAVMSIGVVADASIVYMEDADGLVAGTNTLADSPGWNGAAGNYDVVAGGGAFSTNHFQLTGNNVGGGFNFANWDTGFTGGLQTFSIDLADTGGGGINPGAGVRLAIRRSGPGGATFFDYVSANQADNQIFSYHVVANNSGATATYEDGITTIADNSAQLWVDGVLVQTLGNLNGTGDIFSWGLWARYPDSEVWADNIVIRDTAFNGIAAAVPEPSSLALLGLIGVAGIVRRRRS